MQKSFGQSKVKDVEAVRARYSMGSGGAKAIKNPGGRQGLKKGAGG